jgi:peroxiredoxin
VAPAFVLTDQVMPYFSLEDLVAEGPAVVTFYRGLWCPYCRKDLMCFEESLKEIQEIGASVTGISHNLKLDRGQGFLKPEDVSFPILDDSGEVAVQFGIRWPPDELEIIREYLGTDIGLFRETDPWIVPMQARFVINTDRTVSFAEIAYNYDQRSSPVAVLPILRKLANANN